MTSVDGWVTDPRPIPAELETHYTAAELAAADASNTLDEGQQADLWRTVRDDLDGNTVCEICGSRYPSVKAAILCADADDEDDRRTWRVPRSIN